MPKLPTPRQSKKKLYEFFHTEVFFGLGLNLLRKKSALDDAYFQQLSRSVKDWIVLTLVNRRASLLKSERLRAAIHYLIAEGDLNETAIPFACNATDLVSGKPHLFQTGDIRTAILASSTIPGYFPPVQLGDKKLVDGAVTHNLPVPFARELGADFVVAVDVHPKLHPETEYQNVLEVIMRAGAIMSYTRSQERLSNPDLLISPPIKEYFWYEFDRYREIINAGEEAATMTLDQVPHRWPKPRRVFRRLLSSVPNRSFFFFNEPGNS